MVWHQFSLIKHTCYPQDTTMLTLPDTYSQPSDIGAENAIQLQNTHNHCSWFMWWRHHTHSRAHTQTHAHRHTDTHAHTHTQSTRSTVTLTHLDSHSHTHFYILYSTLSSLMHLKHCPCRLRPVEQSMALDSPLELSGGQWDLSWPPWCLLGVRSTVSAHRNIYIHY